LLARPVLGVARDLLGAVVTARSSDGTVAVRLTEVEAYAGLRDPASHAFRGPTTRTAVMFGPPGYLYVYFTYGMHWCANIVCDVDGTAAAVLLRAGEVLSGRDLARSRRPAARVDRDLARGPARLAGVLGLTGADSGADLCSAGGAIRVHRPDSVGERAVRTGPRVGIRAAADWPWRFWLPAEPTVTAYRPAARPRSRGSEPAGVMEQTVRRPAVGGAAMKEDV
jgi:DNA-3-methyladenine glycosylase